MKKVALFIASMLMTVLSFAQETAPVKTFWDDPIADPLFPLYIVTGFVIVVIILVLSVALYMLRILNLLVEKAAEEKATSLGIAYIPKPSAWQRLWADINGYVPVEKESSIELDHNYDGIKELDNHLPPWWKWLFYTTIAWAFVYIIVYHVFTYLPLSQQEYNNEVAIANDLKIKLQANQPVVASIDESKLEFVNDPAIISRGKTIFTSNCGSCHKENGAGNIGPNLTDEYWIHGGSIQNIYTTIKSGVPQKMIPWGTVLKPEEIRDVAFFVRSLKGSKPADGKAPQGDLYTEEQATQPGVKADSTNVQASL